MSATLTLWYRFLALRADPVGKLLFFLPEKKCWLETLQLNQHEGERR